jgi:hypothetical protein
MTFAQMFMLVGLVGWAVITYEWKVAPDVRLAKMSLL